MSKIFNYLLCFLLLLQVSECRRAILQSYEVQENDFRFAVQMRFRAPIQYKVKEEKKDGVTKRWRVDIPNTSTTTIRGRQNLDHLLAISFYVNQTRNGLRLYFYTRGFFPVKFYRSDDGQTLTFSVENLYPIRSELDRSGRKFVVCIDPGHGGQDVGAQGEKYNEKDMVLEISRHLRDQINKRSDMVAFLTRDADYKIKLEDRLKISDRAAADVFLSLHMNSSTPPTRGFEIFYLSKTGASQNLKVELEAKTKNSQINSKEPTSPLLSKILLDLQQVETVNHSSQFAHELEQRLSEIPGSKNRGVKRQEFVVLKTLETPSVLIEMGFITNKRDVNFLSSKNGRDIYTGKLIEGIENFISNKNLHRKPEVKLQAQIERRIVKAELPEPLKEGGLYTVKPGDTFIKIANRYSISYKSLMKANPQISPKKLQVGMNIRVPQAEN